MQNHSILSGVVQVASSTGYVGGSPWPFRWIARFLLSTYIPFTSKFMGYVPCEISGWGEDLPGGVGRQWAKWCLTPGYVESSFGEEINRHYYDAIKTSILSISATDDAIATDENVDDLLRLFPSADIIKKRIKPQNYGMEEIGHMNFFHTKSKQSIWPLVLEGLK
jgi:predicted alpha/beta hydrolase